MKKKGYSRTQRISDLIQSTLAGILQSEAEELGIGLVTVTGVEVAHDLSHAKVFVSILDDEHAKEVTARLNEYTKNFRYALAQEIKLRVIPELKFVYDDSLVRGSRISSLINDALKNK
jgi:ribosome-binding factor A